MDPRSQGLRERMRLRLVVQDTRKEKQLQSRRDISLELLVALSHRDGWQQQEGEYSR